MKLCGREQAPPSPVTGLTGSQDLTQREAGPNFSQEKETGAVIKEHLQHRAGATHPGLDAGPHASPLQTGQGTLLRLKLLYGNKVSLSSYKKQPWPQRQAPTPPRLYPGLTPTLALPVRSPWGGGASVSFPSAIPQPPLPSRGNGGSQAAMSVKCSHL